MLRFHAMPFMCCNPLKKPEHSYAKQKLWKVTPAMIETFKGVANLDLTMHICNTCRLIKPTPSFSIENMHEQPQAPPNVVNIDDDNPEGKIEMASKLAKILEIEFSARDFKRAEKYRFTILNKIEEKLCELFGQKEKNHYEDCEVLSKAIVSI